MTSGATGNGSGTAAHDLGPATSPELAVSSRTLLVPLGSTEQHGPHLPLDTDTRIATAIARGVAARRPGVLVAPALPYGASGEHAGFAGTLSIGQAALELLVVELVRSAGREFDRIVLVNGHGGNAEALTRAMTTLRHEQRPADLWSPRLVGGDTHAGRIETSLLLALDPTLVHLDRAAPGVTTALIDLMPALRAGGLAAVTANGVLGDPTGATAEEGRRLLAGFIDDLDQVVSGAPVA